MRSKVARTGFRARTTARELARIKTADRTKAISTRIDAGTVP
jgi:hypothetical protein